MVSVRVTFLEMPQFHFTALGYEEMKNPDKKINIEAFRDGIKAIFRGKEGLLTYTRIITEIYHPTFIYSKR